MAGFWDVLVGASQGVGGQVQVQQEQARKLQQIMMMEHAKQMYPNAEEQMSRLMLGRMQQAQAQETQQQQVAALQGQQQTLEANPPPPPRSDMASFPAMTERGAGFVSGRPLTNDGYPAAIADYPNAPSLGRPLLFPDMHGHIDYGSSAPGASAVAPAIASLVRGGTNQGMFSQPGAQPSMGTQSSQGAQPSIFDLYIMKHFGYVPPAIKEQEAAASARGQFEGNPLEAQKAQAAIDAENARTRLTNVQTVQGKRNALGRWFGVNNQDIANLRSHTQTQINSYNALRAQGVPMDEAKRRVGF